jgi:hypothetical protein
MKTADYDLQNGDKSCWYQVACMCREKDCNMTIDMSYEDGIMSISFYKDLHASVYWGDTNFFTRLWRRIKIAARMLFIGYIEISEEHLIKDEKHIDAFIEALKEGKETIKNERSLRTILD